MRKGGMEERRCSLKEVRIGSCLVRCTRLKKGLNDELWVRENRKLFRYNLNIQKGLLVEATTPPSSQFVSPSLYFLSFFWFGSMSKLQVQV